MLAIDLLLVRCFQRVPYQSPEGISLEKHTRRESSLELFNQLRFLYEEGSNMLQKFLTLSSPCLKSKAPGPSVVPAAKAKPMEAGQVFTTSLAPPTLGSETSRLEKSMYACWDPTFPFSFSVALSNSSTAFLNCLSPIMRVLSNSSG